MNKENIKDGLAAIIILWMDFLLISGIGYTFSSPFGSGDPFFRPTLMLGSLVALIHLVAAAWAFDKLS